jgi:hypothetical protein
MPPSLSGGWQSQSRGAGPATWVSRPCSTGSSSKPYYRSCRRNGTRRSPMSPLLANLLLDELDKELEKRGHRFVRYADDAHIYV